MLLTVHSGGDIFTLLAKYPTLLAIAMLGFVVYVVISFESIKSSLFSTHDWRLLAKFRLFIYGVQILSGLAVIDDVLDWFVTKSDYFLLGYAIISITTVYAVRFSGELRVRLNELRAYAESPVVER